MAMREDILGGINKILRMKEEDFERMKSRRSNQKLRDSLFSLQKFYLLDFILSHPKNPFTLFKTQRARMI